MIPFRGTLNIRCRNRIGIQEGTIILTTTYISLLPQNREPDLKSQLALHPKPSDSKALGLRFLG